MERLRAAAVVIVRMEVAPGHSFNGSLLEPGRAQERFFCQEGTKRSGRRSREIRGSRGWEDEGNGWPRGCLVQLRHLLEAMALGFVAGPGRKRLSLHLILPFDTRCPKMGPFEGKTGLNEINSEVKSRPVSIDDSSCVHLGAKLRSRIKSQLLHQLSYRGSQTAHRVTGLAGFVKAGIAVHRPEHDFQR
jgi:hypothetical protein